MPPLTNLSLLDSDVRRTIVPISTWLPSDLLMPVEASPQQSREAAGRKTAPGTALDLAGRRRALVGAQLELVGARREPGDGRRELVNAPRAPSSPAVPDRSATEPGTAPLAVTTLRQAARVAMDRSRRMTLLGGVPVLGLLALPWLLPVHLWIVGRTAGHIRHTPDASLSYWDGTAPRRCRPAVAVGALTGLCWLALAGGLPAALHAAGMRTAAVVLVVVVAGPALIELVALVEFAVLHPQWLTLKARSRRGRPDGRVTYVLTSLVSRRDGRGHARTLMDLTYPQWKAADAVVVGYPASRNLVGYYLRMGGHRERSQRCARRPRRRLMTFDCRVPLRSR